MKKVFACIDGLTNTPAVIDGAAWAALLLDAPLEFLHVLERHPERASVSDYSGAIGLGAQDSLLDELSQLDEQRGKLAQEAGRRLLAAAREHAIKVGVSRLDARLRHGELVDTVLEVEPEARLFVLGEHYHADRPRRVHLDHHVERTIRSVKQPVLVATGEGFTTPRRVVIAFDGSPTAFKTVDTVARSALVAGLPVLLAMAGDDNPSSRRHLDQAKSLLASAGFAVEVELVPGKPEQAIPQLLKSQADALLVMGAYGHSRIRQFVIGSTTATLLRLCESPVLVLR